MHDTLNTRAVVSCRIYSTRAQCPIEFDCAPDHEGARRWIRTFRRIDRVEFVRHAHGWRCVVAGVGHRRPVRRSAPLRIGIGLAELGTLALLMHADEWPEAR